MDALKRGPGRPKGGGKLGAIRTRLSGMVPGEFCTVRYDELTDASVAVAANVVSTVARNAGRDIGDGAKFTVMALDGGVYVRRLA